MIIIETRQAAKDKAFDLIDEIEDLGHKKKMALCELKETLYDCFESSEEDEDEYDESEDRYEPVEESDEDQDIDFRRRGSYRYNRNYAMRSGMRSHDVDDMDMRNSRAYRRRAMRMRRRDRMGRFV